MNNNKYIGAFSLVGLLISLTVLFYFIGCNNQADEISVELGQEVELKPGQTASIEAEELEVKFAGVISDSRCPTGATCVWEGEVSCTLEITYRNEPYTKTIVQPGLSSHYAIEIFKVYEFRFNVWPYPGADEEIKSDEYRLQLVIDVTPLSPVNFW